MHARFTFVCTAVFLATAGCAVRKITTVPRSQQPLPALEASPAKLINRVNAQSKSVQTLAATVDFEPTAGSVYSGVINEYHDVKGFILLERPALIRVLGQAPVVRTNIFDMVSNGQDFEVYIPSKQKFIVGKTAYTRPAKNSLENLRPQHILSALLLPAIDRTQEKVAFEEDQEGGRRYYVITLFPTREPDDTFTPLRKIWFDRSNLEISREQIYGPGGAYLEDIGYSDYKDFQGVRYPTQIRINRPIEDYSLAISLLSATFNQPIGPEKFVLKKPEGAQLVELSSRKPPEEFHGE